MDVIALESHDCYLNNSFEIKSCAKNKVGIEAMVIQPNYNSPKLFGTFPYCNVALTILLNEYLFVIICFGFNE